MRFHAAHIDNLRKFYVDQIEHLHSAEVQIAEALPKMIEAASDLELKRALQNHLQQTREHVSRIEQILRETTARLEPKKNKPIAALIDEAEDIMGDAKNDSVMDAGIIAAAQRVEHYEIASYGAVHNYARILGETSQAGLLEQTLEEEKKANATLTGISDSANVRADKAA
ncbi:MAG TPA: DUF892 family protein [Candidatus Sulfotelmatobacter sp.]|nr:DUF892 family protein [Candidatus Sulfotelmatobacter sp.]